MNKKSIFHLYDVAGRQKYEFFLCFLFVKRYYCCRGANLKDATLELMQTPLHMSQTIR